MMEIGRRYRAEQPASLETARHLMSLYTERMQIAAE
jgi:hypothetical protein